MKYRAVYEGQRGEAVTKKNNSALKGNTHCKNIGKDKVWVKDETLEDGGYYF